MKVRMFDSAAPLSPHCLSKLESRLNITLPDDYRNFLLKYNGGFPNPSVFRFKGKSGPYTDSCVDWFLSVYKGEYHNFETTFLRTKSERIRLPADLVAIGHDPGGNWICIAVSGPHRGSVYFWDHENEAPNEEAPWYRNVHLIADSFDEFLDSLSDRV